MDWTVKKEELVLLCPILATDAPIGVVGFQVPAFVCVSASKGDQVDKKASIPSRWPSRVISEESNHLPTDIKSWLLVHMGSDHNEIYSPDKRIWIKS